MSAKDELPSLCVCYWPSLSPRALISSFRKSFLWRCHSSSLASKEKDQNLGLICALQGFSIRKCLRHFVEKIYWNCEKSCRFRHFAPCSVRFFPRTLVSATFAVVMKCQDRWSLAFCSGSEQLSRGGLVSKPMTIRHKPVLFSYTKWRESISPTSKRAADRQFNVTTRQCALSKKCHPCSHV